MIPSVPNQASDLEISSPSREPPVEALGNGSKPKDWKMAEKGSEGGRCIQKKIFVIDYSVGERRSSESLVREGELFERPTIMGNLRHFRIRGSNGRHLSLETD
jgi:hypothetical protein